MSKKRAGSVATALIPAMAGSAFHGPCPATKLVQPLFQTMLSAVEKRGRGRIFAAYREDWPSIHQFFLEHGFRKTRDMVNFMHESGRHAQPGGPAQHVVHAAEPADLPAVLLWTRGRCC